MTSEQNLDLVFKLMALSNEYLYFNNYKQGNGATPLRFNVTNLM
jgi:hypothetical protein